MRQTVQMIMIDCNDLSRNDDDDDDQSVQVQYAMRQTRLW